MASFTFYWHKITTNRNSSLKFLNSNAWACLDYSWLVVRLEMPLWRISNWLDIWQNTKEHQFLMNVTSSLVSNCTHWKSKGCCRNIQFYLPFLSSQQSPPHCQTIRVTTSPLWPWSTAGFQDFSMMILDKVKALPWVKNTILSQVCLSMWIDLKHNNAKWDKLYITS